MNQKKSLSLSGTGQKLANVEKTVMGGGVAILYRDDEDGIILERKTELEIDFVEGICVKVTINPCISFLLVTSYVPPEKGSVTGPY